MARDPMNGAQRETEDGEWSDWAGRVNGAREGEKQNTACRS